MSPALPGADPFRRRLVPKASKVEILTGLGEILTGLAGMYTVLNAGGMCPLTPGSIIRRGKTRGSPNKKKESRSEYDAPC
jgi:hypothetical protein